jgi:hypothetical protein
MKYKILIALAILFLVAGTIVSCENLQAQPAPIMTPSAAPMIAAPGPVTQNTVSTTGPVESTTTISVGTLAGQVLMWFAAAFSVPVGTILTGWLWRLFKLAGVNATDALRARLNEIVINGLNAGAKTVAADITGKDQVAIRNAVVQQAIVYTQAHGAETIKALGLDPQSGTTVEAIKARIETAINDPAVATPAVLDPIAASTSASK